MYGFPLNNREPLTFSFHIISFVFMSLYKDYLSTEEMLFIKKMISFQEKLILSLSQFSAQHSFTS